MLRVTLFNEAYGQLTLDRNDPDGLNKLVINVKRSKEYLDGVFFEVVIDLKFIKEARPYLVNCFKYSGGLDAKVNVTIYELDANSKRWEIYHQGIVNWNRFIKTDDFVEVAIEQVKPQASVLNAFSNLVDIGPPIEIDLHSKGLKRVYRKTGSETLQDFIGPGHYFFSFSTDEGTSSTEFISEFENRPAYPNALTTTSPLDVLEYRIRFDKEFGTGNFRFKFDFEFADSSAVSSITNIYWRFVYGKNGIYTTENLSYSGSGGVTGFIGTVNDEVLGVTLSKGDEIYLFCEFDLAFSSGANPRDYDFIVTKTSLGPILDFDAITFTEDSTANGVLLFEALDRCVSNASSGNVRLKSNLLGRTDLGYDEDGDASLIVWTLGNQIRKLAGKSIFASIDQILDFLKAAFCVGYTFEYESGQWYFRLERKSYFYDKTSKITELFNGPVEETLKSEVYFNKVVFGYSSEIDVGQVNATDDFNTLREFKSPIVAAKTPLDISTKVRANGSEIENQRRLIGATKDSKLDDQPFVVVVVRDGLGFKAKKAEGYSNVSGVFDYTSGYNYDICPARMLKNWYQYLASTLIYSPVKKLSFTGGKGNYGAATTKTGEDALLESGEVDLANEEPIFVPFTYNFEAPITRAQARLVKAGPLGYIAFTGESGEELNGFIDDTGLAIEPNENKVRVSLLKVFRR